MKSLLIDSSSAILLFKADLFDLVASAYKMIMAESVFREITQKGYPGADHFGDFHQKGLIFVETAKTNKLIDQQEAKASDEMDQGETDTINLYPFFPDSFLIMDDGRGARWCLQTKIPFINALLVPKVLMFSDLVPKDNCVNKMILLCELGRYSNQVKDWAFSCSKEDLAFFIAEDFDESLQ